MSKGELRIYLGAAPGVGKTYAMLAEGQRRRARGSDVVGGLIEAHGRRLTTAMAEGLEIVPRRTMIYRGATFTEIDLDAVLARHPQVALVDELAHTNVPGCRNAKRWQDVDELLEAGIDVITTLNIEKQPSGSGYYIVASAGEQPPEGPGADLELPVTDTMTLACCGRVPAREDVRVLYSCAVQLVAGLDGWPRHEQEAEATRHAADLRSRMTLLAATGKNAREHLEEAPGRPDRTGGSWPCRHTAGSGRAHRRATRGGPCEQPHRRPQGSQPAARRSG